MAIINEEIGLSFKKKIKNYEYGQPINLVFKNKDVVIDENGRFEADVINNAEGFATVSFLGQEFNLSLDNSLNIEDKIRFNLHLEDAIIFVDGNNINENI